ncbi:hypothetical protein K438DRAFT_2075638 [Mycena galopus ATCC 62051]|nr:hypothetical protein K438DRAFT_2075638 [Mycena galopus ATCC 62051]
MADKMVAVVCDCLLHHLLACTSTVAFSSRDSEMVMLTPPPTAKTSSLADRRTTGVRHARNDAVQSLYQSPRARRLEQSGIRSPLRDIGNIPRRPLAENSGSGNTEYRAYVGFSGLAFNSDKPAGKFDIDCEQYTQIAKGGPITVFPASCLVINSPRWKDDAKPVPFPNKFISASGFLVGVEDRTVSGSPHRRRFVIHVDNVIFLGSNAAAAPSTPSSRSSVPSGNKRKRRYHLMVPRPE